jgi:hypothetical protein
VHPGYFFDIAREAFVIVSLLVDPGVFDRAVARVLTRATGVHPTAHSPRGRDPGAAS